MDLRRFLIAKQGVVTAHIIIINRLAEQSDRSLQQKVFCLESFAELMQTKAGMQKSGRALRSKATKFSADCQSARPFFLAHQMMQA